MKTDDPMYYAHIPLRIAYCLETDMLEIHNGEDVISSYGVAKGLTAHLGAEGEPAGFTLEQQGLASASLERIWCCVY